MWQRARAEYHFTKYLEAQEHVDRVEKLVFRQSANRQIMKLILKTYYDPITGRTYAQLCDKRDMHMSVAQASAAMAAMLKEP